MSKAPKAPAKQWSEYTPAEKRKGYIGLAIFAVIIFIIGFSACGGPKNEAAPSPAPVTTSQSAPAVTETKAARIGEPSVYARIAAMKDCGKLQAQFDQAAANGEAARNRDRLDLAQISTEYMSAVMERQNELKCTG